MTKDSAAIPLERRRFILERAARDGIVRIRELAVSLGVHEMTVRRDFDALVEQGLLERVHGGARRAQKTGVEAAYAQRLGQQTEAKARIARAALGLVAAGDTVGLDSSTTALALARLLDKTVGVTAVTTGLDAASALAAADVPFILAGGSFHGLARSFVGGLQRQTLEHLRIDKVFFSAKAWSAPLGFTDVHLPEVESKQALLASGRTLIALLDSSKFGQEAFGCIAATGAVHTLVTDLEPPREAREALEAAEVRVIVAD